MYTSIFMNTTLDVIESHSFQSQLINIPLQLVGFVPAIIFTICLHFTSSKPNKPIVPL